MEADIRALPLNQKLPWLEPHRPLLDACPWLLVCRMHKENCQGIFACPTLHTAHLHEIGQHAAQDSAEAMRPARGQLLVLALVVALIWPASAFREGEFITAARKSQYQGVSTVTVSTL